MIYTAAVAQGFRAFASQAEGSVFESQPPLFHFFRVGCSILEIKNIIIIIIMKLSSFTLWKGNFGFHLFIFFW